MRPAIVVLVGLVLAIGVAAQPHSQYNPARRPQGAPSRGFSFCALQYTGVRSEPQGFGWATDYPRAGNNLMRRFWEMTTVEVAWSGEPGESLPSQWVVNIDNPVSDALWYCPFLFTSDVGTLGWQSPESIARMRDWLLKGGFLWVDDFWGPQAWGHWVDSVYEVLPEGPAVYPILDVLPGHDIFHTLYVSEIFQVPNRDFWLRSGGETSERGAISAEPNIRAIYDLDGRMMILMTHDTDIGDVWQREEHPDYFDAFAIEGYSLGVNALLYAMAN